MDPSWQYALNTAIQKHYVFGNDFVFTYGPLGFLSTANPLYLADHGFSILLYKGILFGGLIALGIYATKKATNIWQKAGIVLVYGLAGRLYSYESSIYYMMLFLALLLWHQKTQKDVLIYFALVFACFNFFIKLNTGLVLLVLLGMYLGALRFNEKLSWAKLLGLAASGSLMVGLISYFTNTNLPAYITNGFEIVRHFPAAESYPVSIGSITFICTMGMLLCFALLLTRYLKSNGKKNFSWINSIMMAGCLFVAFKQGFVRGSYNHQISFFGSSLLLLLIFFTLANDRGISLMQYLAGLGILLFGAIAILKIGIYGFGFSPLKDLYSANDKRIAYMPSRIKKTIGNASIDIFPFEAMHLYYNGLNYAPRPIPQGYQAYSEKLDSLNASYFQNSCAPEFVMLANGSIDNRHPFWDEFQTKLAIRNNYEITDSLFLADRAGLSPRLYWLLKRKEAVNKISKITAWPPWQQSISDTIECGEFTQETLLKINLQPNIAGRLVGLLFQPAILKCHIQYANGSVSQYDAISPILAAGIPVGYKLESNDDIASFLLKQQPLPTNRIDKIWFTGNTRFFNQVLSLQVMTGLAG
jgi:hypothetical protein